MAAVNQWKILTLEENAVMFQQFRSIVVMWANNTFLTGNKTQFFLLQNIQNSFCFSFFTNQGARTMKTSTHSGKCTIKTT